MKEGRAEVLLGQNSKNFNFRFNAQANIMYLTNLILKELQGKASDKQEIHILGNKNDIESICLPLFSNLRSSYTNFFVDMSTFAFWEESDA